MSRPAPAPPINDYGLIGDCHGAALVSRSASIDWCCQPRFDSGSCFGALLDPERGGQCTVTLAETGAQEHSHAYLDDSLVLATRLEGRSSAVRVLDLFAMRAGGATRPRRELVRIVECVRGCAEVQLDVRPRFDYGEVRPWFRRVAVNGFAAIGGDDCILVWSTDGLESDEDGLSVRETLRPGERLRLLMRFIRPHELEHANVRAPEPVEIDVRVETLEWWRGWHARVRPARSGPEWAGVMRSALTLKALSYAPTGAITAAATTSLPEAPGGVRNWDYRYSWIRDSALAANALSELGCEREAKRFRHFIVRSSAGHAADLQILFGIGGERRISESELELAGYQGAKPVRVGNAATRQLQLDALGEILNLGWSWHRRGHSPDDDEWRFFAQLVENAIARWQEPDCGIWEWRGEPLHFVHSKALWWTAVDRGLRLAAECGRSAPTRRWRKAAAEIRDAVERHGYDKRRGVFVQAFGSRELDAALLLLPVAGFVAFDDERMVRTTDAVRSELAEEGFIRRYTRDDELPGKEGAFLPCSFWLAECLARQARPEEAREVFDRAMSAASPLGLFSEEIDAVSGELLGNFPQTLTHLSHVSAAIAIGDATPAAHEL